ncbi:hypothetical protein C6P45_003413 [Maudiozyma exigua]|uniref:Major facilitator superfamily (MFS) profile domain-containing protein n=1 Tax=Maudiozyma exigua TaxID=34358 RepID=A0A9P6VUP3_MAUEX|nr:hypothetical protein C6P45_003413 [Kazachstania exigua]
MSKKSKRHHQHSHSSQQQQLQQLQQQPQRINRSSSSSSQLLSHDDFYSDCYSTFSQITTSTINDIDHLPYVINLRTVTIIIGATIGGLLFGYDTGVISGVLLYLKPSDLQRLQITDLQKEFITSSTSIGSFLGSLISFKLADYYGRRITLAICCAIFILASILMSMAHTLSILIMGRLIVGLAIGTAAQCIPIYLSEISPARIRGFMLTLNSIAITGGQLLSYIISYYLKDTLHSWRYLFGIAALPALLFILILDFIPESPRWLAYTHQYAEAQNSLRMLYPNANSLQINLKLRKLIMTINKLQKYETSNVTNDNILSATTNAHILLENTSPATIIQQQNINRNTRRNNNTIQLDTKRRKMEPKTKRALIIGCILMFFQQVSGFNAFMYYSPIIFSKLDTNNPLIPAMLIAATNFIFTFVALSLVDTLGRRAILLYTIWIMILGLLLASIGFDHNNINLLLGSLIMYVAGYASALGTVPWSSVEFLPLNQRSFGASCISCTNWLTNTIVSLTYLSIMNTIGNENTMICFAFFMLLAWGFVFIWYPEVKGLSLEEIGEVFANGIDVHYIYRNYY